MTKAERDVSMLVNLVVSDVSYLVEVDCGLPELLLCLVEVSHTDFTKVTRVVLVDVGSVVMLATCHTSTTWVLAVLADTTMTGGDVAAAAKNSLADYFVRMRAMTSVLRRATVVTPL